MVDHGMIAARLQGEIFMQGAPVKFVQPDTPFKYLGIHLTLTLDWKHQCHAMLTAVKYKCRAISNRGRPAGMLMKVIRTVIKPMITYSVWLPHTYTLAQLIALDAQLATRAAKAAYKQRVSMSTLSEAEREKKIKESKKRSFTLSFNCSCNGTRWQVRSGTHLPSSGLHKRLHPKRGDRCKRCDILPLRKQVTGCIRSIQDRWLE
jgi:hypothetical protein